MLKEKTKCIKHKVTHKGEYRNLVYLYLICLAFSLTQKKRNSFTFNSENYKTNQRSPDFCKFSLFRVNILINKPQRSTEILLLGFIYSVLFCIRVTSCWMLVLIAPSKRVFFFSLSCLIINKSFDWVFCSLFSEWLANALFICTSNWKWKQY